MGDTTSSGDIHSKRVGEALLAGGSQYKYQSHISSVLKPTKDGFIGEKYPIVALPG